MEAKSRTEYSARNTAAALFSRITAILMGYVLRVIFTHTLSESYVGVNGLFIDIINVLSLSEMGVGTAITYALYRPIAEGDIEKQKSLMKLFSRFYQIVAGIVATLGVALIPFFRFFIRDYHDVHHLILIYLLYLANTVCSYLLIYKKTLMDAHQLLYVGLFYQTAWWIVQDVLQAAVLLFWHDFIAFLVINIVTTVASNVCISHRANRLYPYLKDRDAKLPGESEQRAIFTNVRAMLMHKIGGVIVNNTDNLLLSAFVGLSSAGSYSNYYLVIGSIRQLLNQVYQGITASVGNLGVTEEDGRIRRVFEATFFIGQWMYGFAVISLYELLNPFVEMSFGRQYLFDGRIVMVLCLNFFLNGMRNAALTFRDSMGLFYYDRYKAIVEAVLNLVLSVILVQRLGVIGVFLGTMLSMLLTSTWVEPYVLYKYGFHASCGKYFVSYGIYCTVLAISWFLTDWICRNWILSGALVLVFLERSAVCVLVPNLLYLLCYFRTKEFRFVLQKAWKLLGKPGGRSVKFDWEKKRKRW